MRWAHKTLVIHLQLLLILGGACMLLGACTVVPDQKNWIMIGQTTREEVIERYGQPDFVIASAEGETVIYRPRDARRSPPHVEVPTAQVGPLGTTTTRMESINSGASSSPTNGNLQERPTRELRIHYNAQGIVQELSP